MIPSPAYRVLSSLEVYVALAYFEGGEKRGVVDEKLNRFEQAVPVCSFVLQERVAGRQNLCEALQTRPPQTSL